LPRVLSSSSGEAVFHASDRPLRRNAKPAPRDLHLTAAIKRLNQGARKPSDAKRAKAAMRRDEGLMPVRACAAKLPPFTYCVAQWTGFPDQAFGRGDAPSVRLDAVMGLA
jgi:hypothetical protein